MPTRIVIRNMIIEPGQRTSSSEGFFLSLTNEMCVKEALLAQPHWRFSRLRRENRTIAATPLRHCNSQMASILFVKFSLDFRKLEDTDITSPKFGV